MNSEVNTIWSDLLQASLVQGDAPQAKTQDAASPWHVKALLGFSGWLAAAFLIGFIGLSFQSLIKHGPVAFVIGCGMILFAYFMFKKQSGEFLEHLAIAVSLAGHFFIIYALVDNSVLPSLSWGAIVCIETALAFFVPNFIHRFFSTFIALFALKMVLISNGMFALFDGIVLFIVIGVWQNAFRYPKRIREMHAFVYGASVALMLLYGKVAYGFMLQNHVNAFSIPAWMGEVLLGAAIFYGVWKLLQRRKTGLFDPAALLAFTATLLLSLLSVKIPALGIGVFILLLGFSCSNRVLIGLGGAGMLYAFATYYFQHAPTLMEKSLILLIAGVVLLGMRFAMKIFLTDPKEAEHA